MKKMKKQMKIYLLIVSVLALLTGCMKSADPIQAQKEGKLPEGYVEVINGEISGIVKDSAGLAVANVKVALVNTAMQAFEAYSDKNGRYIIVIPEKLDEYKVVISKTGYALTTEKVLNLSYQLKQVSTNSGVIEQKVFALKGDTSIDVKKIIMTEREVELVITKEVETDVVQIPGKQISGNIVKFTIDEVGTEFSYLVKRNGVVITSGSILIENVNGEVKTKVDGEYKTTLSYVTGKPKISTFLFIVPEIETDIVTIKDKLISSSKVEFLEGDVGIEFQYSVTRNKEIIKTGKINIEKNGEAIRTVVDGKITEILTYKTEETNSKLSTVLLIKKERTTDVVEISEKKIENNLVVFTEDEIGKEFTYVVKRNDFVIKNGVLSVAKTNEGLKIKVDDIFSESLTYSYTDPEEEKKDQTIKYSVKINLGGATTITTFSSVIFEVNDTNVTLNKQEKLSNGDYVLTFGIKANTPQKIFSIKATAFINGKALKSIDKQIQLILINDKYEISQVDNTFKFELDLQMLRLTFQDKEKNTIVPLADMGEIKVYKSNESGLIGEEIEILKKDISEIYLMTAGKLSYIKISSPNYDEVLYQPTYATVTSKVLVTKRLSILNVNIIDEADGSYSLSLGNTNPNNIYTAYVLVKPENKEKNFFYIRKFNNPDTVRSNFFLTKEIAESNIVWEKNMDGEIKPYILIVEKDEYGNLKRQEIYEKNDGLKPSRAVTTVAGTATRIVAKETVSLGGKNYIYLDGKIFLEGINENKLKEIFNLYDREFSDGITGISKMEIKFGIKVAEESDTADTSLFRNIEDAKLTVEKTTSGLIITSDSDTYIKCSQDNGEYTLSFSGENSIYAEQYNNIVNANKGFRLLMTTEITIPTSASSPIYANKDVYYVDSEMNRELLVNSTNNNGSNTYFSVSQKSGNYNVNQVITDVVNPLVSDQTFTMKMSTEEVKKADKDKDFSFLAEGTFYDRKVTDQNGSSNLRLKLSNVKDSGTTGVLGQNYTQYVAKEQILFPKAPKDWAQYLAYGVSIAGYILDSTILGKSLNEKVAENEAARDKAVQEYDDKMMEAQGQGIGSPSGEYYGVNETRPGENSWVTKISDYVVQTETIWLLVGAGYALIDKNIEDLNTKYVDRNNWLDSNFSFSEKEKLSNVLAGTFEEQLNYANAWESFVYVPGSSIDETVQLDIKSLFYFSSARSSGKAKVRVIRELEDLEGRSMYKIVETSQGGANPMSVNQTFGDMLEEKERTAKIPAGWYKFKMRIDKNGYATTDGWAVSAPVGFTVVRSSKENSYTGFNGAQQTVSQILDKNSRKAVDEIIIDFSKQGGTN